jgi:K+-transporting ATPase ATPase C chain
MFKQMRPAVVSVLVITLFTGLLFPAVITGLAQLLFPKQAMGSLVKDDKSKVIGSELIAQGFADPKYFHPRPSAAGPNGWDPTSSGGTNLGPTSDKLINGVHKKLPNGKDDPNNFDGIKDLAKAYRDDNHLPATAEIPPDAVTRSASGLDPDISPENAELQAGRVADTRKLSKDEVLKVVKNNTQGRQLGFLGEPRVNVLLLNLAIDKAFPSK